MVCTIPCWNRGRTRGGSSITVCSTSSTLSDIVSIHMTKHILIKTKRCLSQFSRPTFSGRVSDGSISVGIGVSEGILGISVIQSIFRAYALIRGSYHVSTIEGTSKGNGWLMVNRWDGRTLQLLAVLILKQR